MRNAAENARRSQEETYDDTIYFKLEEGVVGSTGAWTEGKRGFHVPVRALLPTLQVCESARMRLLSLSCRRC